MTIKNKPSHSKKLTYIAAFLIGLSMTTVRAGDGDKDYFDDTLKSLGSYASKFSAVQHAIELAEPLLPKETTRRIREYVPPPTLWQKFKEFFRNLNCINGADNE